MGGFKDNPDPQEFKAEFRPVVWDEFFVQHNLSNCEFHCNKVLLEILSLIIYEMNQNVIKQPVKCPVKTF